MKFDIGKIIQVTFIVAVLVVGGYFGYNWLTNTHGTSIEEIAPVETELVGSVYTSNRTEADVNKEILDVMDEVDGQFFYLEERMNEGRYLDIYKTDMNTFNEKVGNCPDAKKSSKKMSGGLKAFLNMNHSTIVSDPERWFGGLRQNDFRFNDKWPAGDFMYNYFKDNEIVISCDDFKVTKLGTMVYSISTEDPITGEAITPQTSYNRYTIGEGTVTTKNKIGDPNGYFPEVEESRAVKLKVFSGMDDTNMMFSVNQLYME